MGVRVCCSGAVGGWERCVCVPAWPGLSVCLACLRVAPGAPAFPFGAAKRPGYLGTCVLVPPRPAQLTPVGAVPRRWSKRVELSYCGTGCTYGAWAPGPYGGTAVDVRPALPSYRSSCRGRGRSMVPPFFPFSPLSLWRCLSFYFLAGARVPVSAGMPSWGYGGTPSDLEPLTEEGAG